MINVDQAATMYMLTSEQLHTFGMECANMAVQSIKDVLQRHMDTQIEPLYTKKDVAKIFNVSARTIDNWIAEGIFRTTNIGAAVRIDRDEVVRVKELFKKKQY